MDWKFNMLKLLQLSTNSQLERIYNGSLWLSVTVTVTTLPVKFNVTVTAYKKLKAQCHILVIL